MPWILLLLISLFSAPSFAVAIPGVTTGTTASQQSTPPPEPDVEQKKAAYGALADVLENDASRKELIDQLRKAAATPPKETVPTLTPPQVEEQKTVLENVTFAPTKVLKVPKAEAEEAGRADLRSIPVLLARSVRPRAMDEAGSVYEDCVRGLCHCEVSPFSAIIRGTGTVATPFR